MTAIQEALDWLLDEAEADLTDAGSPPDRAYVSHGAPAVDFGPCSQLTVHLVSDGPRSIGNSTRPGQCVTVWWGRVAFQVWRCAPSATPTAEQLGTVSAKALADAEAIRRGIMARIVDGTLLPPGPPYQADIVGRTPIGPTGASAGWQIVLDVELSRPDTPSGS